MPEEVTSTEELEDMIESTEADTALIPSTLTGIVDVNNFSFKEIATVLSKSIGEFKKDTILTPIFVMAETILEVLIPFRTAALIDTLRTGAFFPLWQCCRCYLERFLASLLLRHLLDLLATFDVICSVTFKGSRLPLLTHSLRHL